MKRLSILSDFNDAFAVEDALQNAIREAGQALGTSRVSATIARDLVLAETKLGLVLDSKECIHG